MIKHILVDLDGVLANFFDAALELHGFDVATYPAGEWDIATVLKISADEFWSKIDADESFWRELQPYPWTNAFLSWLDDTRIPWTVATSPSRNPFCAAHKIEWMRKHFGRPAFKNYMIGSRKELMANPTTILIDDSDMNVDAFAQAGGLTYLFPQHWNAAGKRDHPMRQMAEDLYPLVFPKM